MFEWQVSEEDDSFLTALDEDERPPRRWRIPWRVLLGWSVILVIVAGGVLRWRIAERDRAVRADLTAVVTQEERARLFGLIEDIPTLVAEDAPDYWREAYQTTFRASQEAQAVSVEVADIALRQDAALVTVQLDGHSQRRYYQLENGLWRRAPLPDEEWGEAVEPESLNALPLTFREGDASFGRQLEADLAPLVAQLEGWTGWRPVQAILVEPHEFDDPLIPQRPVRDLVSAERIVLNTTQLLH